VMRRIISVMRRIIPETSTPTRTKLHIEGQSGCERAARISSIFSIRQRVQFLFWKA
jgi:hypothetical protein